MAQENTEKKKVLYNPDGTSVEEKDDRSVKGLGQAVENAPVPPAQVAGTPDVGVTPMQGAQSVQPVQQPQNVQGVQGVQPQVMQAPSVDNTAVQPTQVVAQPQPVNVAPVETAKQNVGGATLPQPPAKVNNVPAMPVEDRVEDTSANPDNVIQGYDGAVQGAAPEGISAINASLATIPTAQNEGQQGTTASTTATAPLFKSDPALQKQYEAEVNSWNLNGNVDMYNRPMVSGRDMRKMGWRDFGSPEAQASTATIYTSRWSYNGGGKNHDLVVTPIAANGRVLSPEKLEEYVDYLIANGKTPEGIIALDKRKGNLLVGVDLPEDIEGKIHQAHEKYYLGGGQPENGKNTASTGTTQPHEYSGVKSTNDLDSLSDEALEKLYTVNSGKEGANARLVADKAAEILGQRGKAPQGDVRLQSPFDNKTSIDKLALDPNAGTAPKQTEPEQEEEKEEATFTPSAEDVQRNIDVLEQILKDEKASEAAKKEAEERLAEWKKIIDTPAPSTSPSGLKDDDKLHDGTTVKDYKAMHKDSSKEVIKAILDATRGLEGYDNDIKVLEDLYREKGGVLEPPKKAEAPEAKLEDMPNYKDAIADRDKKQAELDELLKSKDSYKAVALEQYNKWRKDEGLSEEDEKKVEKRHRTARIIANIGDVLQGFANLAGTWYGANSSSLTSLSASAGAAQEKELTAREKRRDKLQKNYETLLAQLKKDGDTDIAQRVAALKAANDRLNKISDNFYTEQNKQRNRKEAQEHATEEHGKRQKITTEEANKRVAYKAEKQQETDNNKSKNRQSEIAAASAGRVHEKRVAGEEARKTKRTPSYNDTHGGKGSKKSKKRKSKGTVHG